VIAGEKVSYDINVCMFRDKHYSHSPCSRPGKYAVRVSFSNASADYWDAGSNTMMKLSEVWIGKAICNEIRVEVVSGE
jgi:hypothetical protein